MTSNIYYHGSPILDLTYLAANSYITSYLYLVIVFGRYHISTGKTWCDKDLIKPFDFINSPYFRENCISMGIPTVYMIKPNEKDIDFLSNPFEHIITVDIKVEK
jgi:hypothetical protein